MNTTGIPPEKRRALARECLQLAERIDGTCGGLSLGLVSTMVECDELESAHSLLRDIATGPEANNEHCNLGLIAYQEGVLTGEQSLALLSNATGWCQDWLREAPYVSIFRAIALGDSARSCGDEQTSALVNDHIARMTADLEPEDRSTISPVVDAYFERWGIGREGKLATLSVDPQQWTSSSRAVFDELLHLGEDARADEIAAKYLLNIDDKRFVETELWVSGQDTLGELVYDYEEHGRTERLLELLPRLAAGAADCPGTGLWDRPHDIAVHELVWIAQIYYAIGNQEQARSTLESLALLERNIARRWCANSHVGLSEDDELLFCHTSRAIAAVVALEACDYDHARTLAKLANKGVDSEKQRFWTVGHPRVTAPENAWRYSQLGYSSELLASVYAGLGWNAQLERTLAFVRAHEADNDASAREVNARIRAVRGYVITGKQNAAKEAAQAALQAYEAYEFASRRSRFDDEDDWDLGPEQECSLAELSKLAIEAFGLEDAEEYIEALVERIANEFETEPYPMEGDFSLVANLLVRQGQLTRLLVLSMSHRDPIRRWSYCVSHALRVLAIRLAKDTLGDWFHDIGAYEKQFQGPDHPQDLSSTLDIDTTELERFSNALDECASAFSESEASLKVTWRKRLARTTP